MGVSFPYGVTVTLRSNATTIDNNGDATSTSTDTDWGPVAVAPRFAAESTDPRVPPVVVGKTFFGPAATINSDDVIVLDGVAYEVDGLPEDYTGTGRNPFTGWEPGIVVQTKRASAQ